MQIINLTPHDITILNEDKEVVKIIPKSGKIARLDSNKERVNIFEMGKVLSIPFFVTQYGIPILLSLTDEKYQAQLPKMREDIIYIVSGLFRASYDRDDLWQPGELVRNENGQPIGCIGLSQ